MRDQMQIIQAVLTELDRAESLHPEWPEDMIYAASIVTGRIGIMIQAVWEFRTGRETTREVLMKRAVQVAAMALRFLKNL